jgi:dihydropteroate synthase
MQEDPVYGDVVADVCSFLQARIESCVMQGIDRSRLLVDPGFGFGKSLQHNLVLLNRLDALKALGCPVLIGTSRKSMIGAVLDKAVDERLYGSLSTVVLAVNKGARVIRVHDVRASREVVDMAWAVINEKF